MFLTFSWVELQILLRCCLVHISIIIPRHFLYLLYLCPCLDVNLFMFSLSDLFSFSSLFLQTYFFFCLFFRICTIIFEWCRGWRLPIIFTWQKFSVKVLLSICLIFYQIHPGVAYRSVSSFASNFSPSAGDSACLSSIFKVALNESPLINWDQILWVRQDAEECTLILL